MSTFKSGVVQVDYLLSLSKRFMTRKRKPEGCPSFYRQHSITTCRPAVQHNPPLCASSLTTTLRSECRPIWVLTVCRRAADRRPQRVPHSSGSHSKANVHLGQESRTGCQTRSKVSGCRTGKSHGWFIFYCLILRIASFLFILSPQRLQCFGPLCSHCREEVLHLLCFMCGMTHRDRRRFIFSHHGLINT